MAQLAQSMSEKDGGSEEDVAIREVQTAKLRLDAHGSSIFITVTEAIRVAGLEDGGSFRFDPATVDELGMLAALGSEERVDGRSNPLARNIKNEGAGSTLRLVFPQQALEELVDVDEIDWDNPPELNVWAGPRMLAFELPEKRTVSLSRNDDEGSDRGE